MSTIPAQPPSVVPQDPSRAHVLLPDLCQLLWVLLRESENVFGYLHQELVLLNNQPLPTPILSLENNNKKQPKPQPAPAPRQTIASEIILRLIEKSGMFQHSPLLASAPRDNQQQKQIHAHQIRKNLAQERRKPTRMTSAEMIEMLIERVLFVADSNPRNAYALINYFVEHLSSTLVIAVSTSAESMWRLAAFDCWNRAPLKLVSAKVSAVVAAHEQQRKFQEEKAKNAEEDNNDNTATTVSSPIKTEFAKSTLGRILLSGEDDAILKDKSLFRSKIMHEVVEGNEDNDDGIFSSASPGKSIMNPTKSINPTKMFLAPSPPPKTQEPSPRAARSTVVTTFAASNKTETNSQDVSSPVLPTSKSINPPQQSSPPPPTSSSSSSSETRQEQNHFVLSVSDLRKELVEKCKIVTTVDEIKIMDAILNCYPDELVETDFDELVGHLFAECPLFIGVMFREFSLPPSQSNDGEDENENNNNNHNKSSRGNNNKSIRGGRFLTKLKNQKTCEEILQSFKAYRLDYLAGELTHVFDGINKFDRRESFPISLRRNFDNSDDDEQQSSEPFTKQHNRSSTTNSSKNKKSSLDYEEIFNEEGISLMAAQSLVAQDERRKSLAMLPQAQQRRESRASSRRGSMVFVGLPENNNDHDDEDDGKSKNNSNNNSKKKTASSGSRRSSFAGGAPTLSRRMSSFGGSQHSQTMATNYERKTDLKALAWAVRLVTNTIADFYSPVSSATNTVEMQQKQSLIGYPESLDQQNDHQTAQKLQVMSQIRLFTEESRETAWKWLIKQHNTILDDIQVGLKSVIFNDQQEEEDYYNSNKTSINKNTPKNNKLLSPPSTLEQALGLVVLLVTSSDLNHQYLLPSRGKVFAALSQACLLQCERICLLKGFAWPPRLHRQSAVAAVTFLLEGDDSHSTVPFAQSGVLAASSLTTTSKMITPSLVGGGRGRKKSSTKSIVSFQSPSNSVNIHSFMRSTNNNDNNNQNESGNSHTMLENSTFNSSTAASLVTTTDNIFLRNLANNNLSPSRRMIGKITAKVVDSATESVRAKEANIKSSKELLLEMVKKSSSPSMEMFEGEFNRKPTRNLVAARPGEDDVFGDDAEARRKLRQQLFMATKNFLLDRIQKANQFRSRIGFHNRVEENKRIEQERYQAEARRLLEERNNAAVAATGSPLGDSALLGNSSMMFSGSLINNLVDKRARVYCLITICSARNVRAACHDAISLTELLEYQHAKRSRQIASPQRQQQDRRKSVSTSIDFSSSKRVAKEKNKKPRRKSQVVMIVDDSNVQDVDVVEDEDFSSSSSDDEDKEENAFKVNFSVTASISSRSGNTLINTPAISVESYTNVKSDFAARDDLFNFDPFLSRSIVEVKPPKKRKARKSVFSSGFADEFLDEGSQDGEEKKNEPVSPKTDSNNNNDDDNPLKKTSEDFVLLQMRENNSRTVIARRPWYLPKFLGHEFASDGHYICKMDVPLHEANIDLDDPDLDLELQAREDFGAFLAIDTTWLYEAIPFFPSRAPQCYVQITIEAIVLGKKGAEAALTLYEKKMQEQAKRAELDVMHFSATQALGFNQSASLSNSLSVQFKDEMEAIVTDEDLGLAPSAADSSSFENAASSSIEEIEKSILPLIRTLYSGFGEVSLSVTSRPDEFPVAKVPPSGVLSKQEVNWQGVSTASFLCPLRHDSIVVNAVDAEQLMELGDGTDPATTSSFILGQFKIDTVDLAKKSSGNSEKLFCFAAEPELDPSDVVDETCDELFKDFYPEDKDEAAEFSYLKNKRLNSKKKERKPKSNVEAYLFVRAMPLTPGVDNGAGLSSSLQGSSPKDDPTSMSLSLPTSLTTAAAVASAKTNEEKQEEARSISVETQEVPPPEEGEEKVEEEKKEVQQDDEEEKKLKADDVDVPDAQVQEW